MIPALLITTLVRSRSLNSAPNSEGVAFETSRVTASALIAGLIDNFNVVACAGEFKREASTYALAGACHDGPLGAFFVRTEDRETLLQRSLLLVGVV
eukprot:CAMPEP_0170475972 /NCGR_PEP_ID=MMETSP0123-20130129/17530_1 /TAXON_ID=182087 /ORGANISM="Favella ehrenbergii, Strain Fehren 1" /LENGTH=96 /DNA_ID=CAMNT_0010746831 /DNA_START=541 /DNA_END=828 /DNA_ORIENTATION=-